MKGHFIEEDTFTFTFKVTQSCPTLRLRGLYSTWNFPGQNTGVDSLSLLQLKRI